MHICTSAAGSGLGLRAVLGSWLWELSVVRVGPCPGASTQHYLALSSSQRVPALLSCGAGSRGGSPCSPAFKTSPESLQQFSSWDEICHNVRNPFLAPQAFSSVSVPLVGEDRGAVPVTTDIKREAVGRQHPGHPCFLLVWSLASPLPRDASPSRSCLAGHVAVTTRMWSAWGDCGHSRPPMAGTQGTPVRNKWIVALHCG